MSILFIILNTAFLGFAGPSTVLTGTKDYRTKLEDFTVPPNWIPFKTTLTFKLYEISSIFKDAVVGDEENISDLYRLGKLPSKDVTSSPSKAVRSLNPNGFNSFKSFIRNQFLPVGLLLVMANNGGYGDNNDAWIAIKEWLQNQAKGSVVYIVFGSEAELSQGQLTEIALGLELSGLPFCWVLRRRSESADNIQ
ncbi:hypothetical protein ACSBR2_012631 [Camellia fascicularis]